MRNKLTIIIPARNEEEIIIKTLDTLKNTVKAPHEIIVVDDCSTDNTKKIVFGYKRGTAINIVSTKKGQNGFAQAIKLGIKNAKGNFIVLVMADLCDESRKIDEMYKKINEGWDVVCGSRYTKGGKKISGPKLRSFN